jgi:hypothetical protein
MKTKLFLAASLAAAGVIAAPPDKPMARQPGPPVVTAAPGAAATVNTQVYVYEQKPVSGVPVLITPEQAKVVIEKFKAGYEKMGKPRIAIYVNRDLVDTKSGMRLGGVSEKADFDRTTTTTDFTLDPNAAKALGGQGGTIRAGGNVSIGGQGTAVEQLPGKGTTSTTREKGTASKTFTSADRQAAALADKQTVRDVERLFGRPLRHGGAALTDQRTFTQLIPSGKFDREAITTEGEEAKKDREALSKMADVVLEVLISSRQLVVQEVSGDKVYSVPDIQATAIQLKDGKIMGQASASDILGKDRFAGRIVRNFDVREIAEATALALMEDMMVGVP